MRTFALLDEIKVPTGPCTPECKTATMLYNSCKWKKVLPSSLFVPFNPSYCVYDDFELKWKIPCSAQSPKANGRTVEWGRRRRRRLGEKTMQQNGVKKRWRKIKMRVTRRTIATQIVAMLGRLAGLGTTTRARAHAYGRIRMKIIICMDVIRNNATSYI